jgi:predicted transcriptional regulator
VIADDVAKFVQDGLGSVWALNLMLALREHSERSWSAAELVAYLRASDTIVRELLPRLRALGLAVDLEGGQWGWRPASQQIDDLCRRVAEEYALRPVGIVNLIARRRDNVRLLADAFRLRRD